MSSRVFERTRPHLEQGVSVGRKLTRLLSWGVGAVALALAVAGCGGGSGDPTPNATAPAQTNQVAAFALTQQSVMERMAAPQTVALVAAPTGTANDNLIANGGFESGMSGWVNWGNASVVSGQASSGTAALSVSIAGGGAGYEVAGIVAGSTYRLTAQATVGALGDTVYVGVNFLDQLGAAVRQNAVPITSMAYTTARFDVVAPPTAVKAVVYVWKNAGSGPAYVDDVAFAAVAGAAPAVASSGNLVTNGGFETALLTWANWGNSASTADAGAASWAAQVGIGAGGFGQQVVGGVVAGNSYRVSALAKVSSADETGYLGVMFMDQAGTALLAQNVVFRSTTYSTVQADLTAPANATRALVFVWKNAGAGFAFVDEVALVQVTPGPGTPPPPPPPPPPVVDTATRPEVAVSSPVGSPVFQLPWGGEVSVQPVPTNSNVLRVYSSAGVQVGPATTINFGESSATALHGGGFAAVGVQSTGVQVGSQISRQIFTQAFNAAGQPIGSPHAIAFSPVGDDLGNPAAVPQLAPLAGGGYLVVWALQQSAPNAPNDRGVYTQRFDANGQPAGPVQQATADGAGFLHITGTTTGGYVVSWGKSAGTVGGARAYGADGAPIGPEQVAGGSWHTGAGPRGAMAPLAGGGAVLVWQVRAQPVFVQFITGAGVALPAQMASETAPSFYGMVAVAGLPDGGSVVAWVERIGAAGNVYARRYAADGTPLGPQTRINLTTTPTNVTDIMVLADGSFSIVWDVGSARYARTFPAGGLVAP